MVRPIDSAAEPHALKRAASSPASPDTTTEVAKPGAHGIGRQAKAEILARADGRELPNNIQGQVASARARGLDLNTIVSLQEIAEPAPPADGEAAIPDEPANVIVDPEVDVLPTGPVDETLTGAELAPTVDAGAQVLLEDAVSAESQLVGLVNTEPT